MKIQYVIDRLGRNPNYNPPQRGHFVGPDAAEAYADALAVYAEPVEVLVPAGSIHGGQLAWVHCFPDQSGIAFKRDDNGKVVPYRKSPGMVVAIPADKPCELMLALKARENATSRGLPLQSVLDEIAAGLAQSRAMQAAAEASKPTETAGMSPEIVAPAAVNKPAVVNTSVS